MFENISVGLDIASALSIIGAAIAFIWNSVRSKKKEFNERQKERIESLVFKVIDKVNEESSKILNQTSLIADKIANGETTQDLNPWRDKIYQLPDSFIGLTPLDNVYVKDGRFIKLEQDFRKELEEFMKYFAKLVNPNKEKVEKWDFWAVMNTPSDITIKYISKLYQETENLLVGN